MKSTKLMSLGTVSVLVLAACETTTAPTTTTAGKTLEQIQMEYPDLGPVEFTVLDDNNDNLISPEEEMDIGLGEDELDVSDN